MTAGRPILAAALAALSLALVSPAPSAGFFTAAAGARTPTNGVPASTNGAATSYVDGISDQSLPAWDGNFDESWFAGLFDDTWVHGPGAHVDFARYVVQWNVMSGDYPRYLREFEAWLGDVASLGLTPEIALTGYDGVASRYRGRISNRAGEDLGSCARPGTPDRVAGGVERAERAGE